LQELAELMANPLNNIYVEPSETNMLSWKVIMIGPVSRILMCVLYTMLTPTGRHGHDFPFKAPSVS
jgi:ubiquitin-protein ligase